jgi:hypothetical protein
VDRPWHFWIIAAVAVYQLLVTGKLLLAGEYSAAQKLRQFLMIWLLPFFGALVCDLFIASDRRLRRARSTRFTTDGGSNPPGISDVGHH